MKAGRRRKRAACGADGVFARKIVFSRKAHTSARRGTMTPGKAERDSIMDFPQTDDGIRGDEAHGRFLAPEWHEQSGVEIVWPTAETDWADTLGEVTETYLRIAREIASRERLLVVTSDPEKASTLLKGRTDTRTWGNITVAECEINDTWARDTGFLTVLGRDGTELSDFGFNGWGNKFEAGKDNAVNLRLYNGRHFRGTYVSRKDFVLEGGSIETDGRGTLLTTESCLLAPNRNPHLSKSGIEARLKQYFNVSKILWLRHGRLQGDDTDGHIDTLARMCPQGRIAYVKCCDPDDAHYESLGLMEKELQSFVQPSGEPYRLVPLPFPKAVCLPGNGGGEGERLPATYANYLVINGAVLLPVYGQPENDEKAARILKSIFPRRKIVPIPCLPLLRQHGSLHCSAMQFPANVMPEPDKDKSAQ